MNPFEIVYYDVNEHRLKMAKVFAENINSISMGCYGAIAGYINSQDILEIKTLPIGS